MMGALSRRKREVKANEIGAVREMANVFFCNAMIYCVGIQTASN